MAGSLRLVVARYREDLGWLDRVHKRWHRTIVTKSVQVPNTGREASSYLWAMTERAYNDPGLICFVQGNPFDHAPDLLETLNALGDAIRALEVGDVMRPLGLGSHYTDGEGRPNHFGLDVKGWFEDLVGPWDSEQIPFVPGAQFVLSGSVLRSRSREELTALRERVDNSEHGPWIMERLWLPYFVMKSTQESATA